MSAHKSRLARVFGTSTAVAGIAAAGLLMAAPANAAATGVTIESTGALGSAGQYGTGCTYTVKVTVDNTDQKVFLLASDEKGVGAPVNTLPNGQTSVTFKWTPDKTGTWTLAATQGGKTTKITEKVGTGIKLPDTSSAGGCLVQPA